MLADSQTSTPELSTPRPSESSPEGDAQSPARNKVHVVINNKGGIGKTIVSMNLIQYLRDSRKLKVQAIDLDPMNHTLAEYPNLRAKPVTLLAKGGEIHGPAVDDLAQSMLTDDASFVIDNGAAGFTRFGDYLSESEFAELLASHGRDLIVHAVIAGGDMAGQCILGLHGLMTVFPAASVPFVVWLNEHNGPVLIDDMGFQDMKIYRDNAMRIAGLVHLPRLSPLFLQDFNEMIRRRLTYEEAIASPHFNIMNKQRLVQTRRAVWKQLDGIAL